MSLTPEQKKTVASWIEAGDNLSTVQTKLTEQFKLSMTYRDVRFLVDDLNLAIKDAAPKLDTSDVSKAQPVPAASPAQKAGSEKKGFIEKAKEKLGLGGGAQADSDADAGEDEEFDEDEAAGSATVRVSVDEVTLLPGAIASGAVTFSDGVSAKWVVDQYGRPGFSEISQPGYRPSPADGQAFVRALSAMLQKRGL